MSEPDHIVAHKHSFRNRDEVMRSDRCGCFNCLALFPPAEIEHWVIDGPAPSDRTAQCPRCVVDSVIGSDGGYPLTPDFLTRMQGYWFGKAP